MATAPDEVDAFGRPIPARRLAVLPPPPTDADNLGTPAPFAMPENRYRCSDVGNANRFNDRFGKDVRWCGAMPGDGLLTWDGTRWKPDEMKRTLALAQAVAMEIVQDAEEAREHLERLEGMATSTVPMEGDPMTLKARIKRATARFKDLSAWAKATEMSARLSALIAVALPDIAVRHDAFDADAFALNTMGGIVDLRTGDVHPHRRDANHTKVASAAPDTSADCPLWRDFLFTIMGGGVTKEGDDVAHEMVCFLQRAIGYSSTASTRDQCLFICYGAAGGNGKSTFLDVLRVVLGDYASHTRAETFMSDARKSSIPNDIAALRGARFVTASEPEQGAVLDEPLVKEMTGDKAMTARFMRSEFFTFEPTFKVWLATNHRPIIKSTARAIWRRIHLIPFNVSVPEDRWDRELPTKLLAERDAILRWVIHGAMEWQCRGLQPPRLVRDATSQYRSDMDILSEFIAEKCVLASHHKVTHSDLYRAFSAWRKDNGENTLSKHWFTRALHDRGYKREDRKDEGYRWEGIGLRTVVSANPDPGRWAPSYGEG